MGRLTRCDQPRLANGDMWPALALRSSQESGMSEADSPPIGTTAVDFDMGGLIAVRSPTLTPALPGVPGRTTTSGGGSITTARSGKPPISCAARLLRFANAWAIAEADAIGDPSLLRDGLTDRDRIALETYRDARAG